MTASLFLHRPSSSLAKAQVLIRPHVSSWHSRRSPRYFSFTPNSRPSTQPRRPQPASPQAPSPQRSSPLSSPAIAGIAGTGLLLLALGIYSAPSTWLDAPASYHADDAEQLPDINPATFPRFSIEEIRKHGAKSETPWVMCGNKVYDITEWVSAHPGGQIILRAAGGSIDPYWDIFSIHKTQLVRDILSQLQIGYVDPADLVDGKPAQSDIEDPFAHDPERHPSLIAKTTKPCNAETPGDVISAKFLTPNELFYVRNHLWVPQIEHEDPGEHLLQVELLDGTIKEYTLHDLKSKFKKRNITAVLQCSGNRRKDMSERSGRSTQGLQWSTGAISNASWEGVLLADVLADAGFCTGLDDENEAKHVQFSGLEAYGASIPIKKAVDPQGDVLLAYSMNGKPLPPDHGFPLRAIVPGHVAARSVKWLNHIALSEEESSSQWQRRDYKCFGPNETKVDWDAAPAIQELPVQSAITGIKLGNWMDTAASAESSRNGSGQESGKEASNSQERITTPPQETSQQISLTGYAFSGGGRSIIRVDVSVDDGSTWSQAYLVPDCASQSGSPSPCQGHGAWTWKRWMFNGSIPLEAFQDRPEGGFNRTGKEASQDQGPPPEATEAHQKASGDASSSELCTTVVVKATDDAYNSQPESHAATWNVRGNLATAWHRVQVCSDCEPSRRNPTGAEENLPRVSRSSTSDSSS